MRVILLLFFGVTSLVFSQKPEIISIEEIPLRADQFMGVDEFNNIYYINREVLYKKNSEKEYQFSDIQLGTISSVDFTNPLRITVFYERFNTAVILDNTLNEITRVNFNQMLPFRNVSYARTASDRRLWIYNVDRQRLEIFNYQANNLLANTLPQPEIAQQMTANFNKCWIYANNSLKTFNIYGNLIEEIHLNNLKLLGQNNNTLWGLQNEKVVFRPRDSTQFISLEMEENQIKNLYYAGKILYIYTGKILKTYTLNLPKK